MTNSGERYGWAGTTPTYSQSYLQPAILDILKSRCTSRVIDLGCGNGVLARLLSEQGFETVGCEPDADGFAIARASASKATVLNVGVYDDPAKVGRRDFDAAVSTEVIEHLFDPAKLFSFAHEVLAPSGLLIVSTPYHGFLKNAALSLTNKWDFHFHPSRVGGHIKFWSRATLSQMFVDHGFDLIEFRGAGRLPYLWKSMIVVGRKRS